MNREVTFRGQKLGTNQWVYGSLIQGCDILGLPHAYIVTRVYHGVSDGVWEVQMFPVCPESVGQGSSIKDDQSKLIFEGDVVKWIRQDLYMPETSLHHQTSELTCEVYYDQDRHMFRMRGKFDSGGGFDCPLDFKDERASSVKVQVVGNIHDNPKLKID